MTVMDTQAMVEAIADEIADILNEWFDQIDKKDAEDIIRRTTLQIGVHDYVRFEYDDGSIRVFSFDDDFSSPEFESQGSRPVVPLTKESIEQELLPQLEERLLRRLKRYDSSPLLDYRFRIAGKFALADGEWDVIVVDYINQSKRNNLLERIHQYIRNKLEAKSFPTAPLDSFFLSNHLVDSGLFPTIDLKELFRIYDRVLELNKSKQEKLAEHRATFIRAFRSWTETEFLPLYFHCAKQTWGLPVYTKKEGIDPSSIDSQAMELALQTAILIIKHEPNYSRSTGIELLELLKELGSTRAEQAMENGSGTLPDEDISYKDSQLECRANDIFSTITIHIKEERADSYAKALDFICNLLNKGFSRSYQIKLKSKSKQLLPIPGLAKSQTHRFFANALQYAELFPKLESYARLAMVEHEWYDDTEGEKNCMPGTYAVFGLALQSKSYFPLVEAYMSVVDQEHQSVQQAFTLALIQQYGIDSTTLPTVAACLLRCNEGKFAKEQARFESAGSLQALLTFMEPLKSHEVEHLAYLIWGSRKNLEARARKEAGEEEQQLFAAILARMDKRK
ncbi:DUF6138 family protein [Paenibacillus sp. OAS669]|uniref:DUF6138 family protein n=1 Tax=Paenibacillus sp. OAS669 TaxID=2663821 RepID=UPI001A109D84|nr:DUF6138 family protein [Paenibacillus sp. OAS669]MBE1442935.1 hypothetical protein [Paenibacillus sp. OAS669]